jgi:uncharacterized membrane protein/predicted DsbA family dithiol-disulfide isomerase
LFALTGLAASTALLVDSLHSSPVYCSYEMGCAEVLASPYARPLGVPLPVVGVLAFAVLFGLSLFPPRRGWLFPVLALAAGAAGLGLILVQVLVLEQVCPLCLIVDLSAVALAGAQLLSGRMRLEGALPAWVRWGWLGLGAGVLGVMAALGVLGPWIQNQPAPEQVRAHWVEGKVNVVEVADFDCPHCRKMHGVLTQLLRMKGDSMHLVRIVAPMPSHADARHAARAYLCAEKLGKGEAMAEALFAAEDLSPSGCEKLAGRLGLPGRRFRACMADRATEEQIDATLSWVKESCPQGLPVLWIQDEMVFGLQPLDVLYDKVVAAERRLAHPH